MFSATGGEVTEVPATCSEGTGVSAPAFPGGSSSFLATMVFLTRVAPWRISTLKYLEVKIEEWPSRAKWGQAGSNRAKWCQTGSNGATRGQTGPKRAKKGLRSQKWPKGPNGAKRDQMGSYGADFLHARIFL